MFRWSKWIGLLLIFTLLAACGNAANYLKEDYPLVNVDGVGKNNSKVYLIEGKNVPTAAKELAEQEKPEEISKEDLETMFLVYTNRIINLQQDPENAENTLAQVDTIEYAKEHYDSSFLEGYLTATILNQVFSSDWFKQKKPNDYRGYSKSYTGTGTTSSSSSGKSSGSDVSKPATTDRSGSFSTKPGTTSSSAGTTGTGSSSSASSGSSSKSSKAAETGSAPDTSSRTGSFSTSGTGSTSKSSSSAAGSSGSSSASSSKSSSSSSKSSSSSTRKNDGSTSSVKSSSSSKSKSSPSTSSRSGSFSSKKR